MKAYVCRLIRLLSSVIVAAHVQISEGNAQCWISPSRVLNIINGSDPSTLTCTASCQNIIAAYFSDQHGHDILDEGSIRPFLTNPNFVNSGENCTYSLNISWIGDDQTRNMLNFIYCKVVYTENMMCTTEKINITFIDVPEASMTPTTVAKTEVPTTSKDDPVTSYYDDTLAISDPPSISRSQINSQIACTSTLLLFLLLPMFVCLLQTRNVYFI